MAHEQAIWPDVGAPAAIKSWVKTFFPMADSKGKEAAKRFGELFHDESTMIGMTGPLHGRESSTTSFFQDISSCFVIVLTDQGAPVPAIYQSRLKPGTPSN